MAVVEVRADVRIPESELVITTSRSGGPGGQNVNKVESRVELRFDLEASPSLTPEQKLAIRARLGRRVSREGHLRVVSQRHRTQGQNRVAAKERFAELLRAALAVPRSRRPTRVSQAAKRRRLETKRQRSARKRERSVKDGD